MVIGFFSTVFITLCHLPACCILSSDLQFRWWLFIWLHLLPLAVFIYMKSILIMFKMTLFTYALTSAITSNNVSVNRSSFYSCAVPDCHYCPVTLCNQLQEENIVFGSSDQLYCTVTVVLKVFSLKAAPVSTTCLVIVLTPTMTWTRTSSRIHRPHFHPGARISHRSVLA